MAFKAQIRARSERGFFVITYLRIPDTYTQFHILLLFLESHRSAYSSRPAPPPCQLSRRCHRQLLLHAVEVTGLRAKFAASGMYLELVKQNAPGFIQPQKKESRDGAVEVVFMTVLDVRKRGELVILDEEVRLELIIDIEAIK